MRAGLARATWLLTLAGIALATSSGCALSARRGAGTIVPLSLTLTVPTADADGRTAAEAYFEAGQEAEADGDPACIDHYLAAAQVAWTPAVQSAAAGRSSWDDEHADLYRRSLQSLLTSAQHFGRLDFLRGIQLSDGRWIPATYHAFLWNPDELQTLVPADECESSELTNRITEPGVGAACVLVTGRSRRPFIRDFQPLAATAVLSPVGPAGDAGWTLEFYDPLRVRTTESGLPLAYDLSASIALSANRDSRAWLENFLWAQQRPQDLGLYMAEPYQPGKIPLVLVHGIASSPAAWANFTNEARAVPSFAARYQVWAFRYDTGAPFLLTAAELRASLAAIRHSYDPQRVDPSLSNIVIMGHSMGGLLAKLQVTESHDQLWRSAARQPLPSIYTDQRTRTTLARSFFFRPSPDITRVIYVATPHRGSGYARRCIGSVSSSLVAMGREFDENHQQLMQDNPNAFYEELTRRFPTSIDLLRPDSPILQTTNTLCYRPGVCLHSIVGDHCWSPLEGRTDGVVPLDSARLAGVHSELIVDATHTHIERHPAMIREALRILLTHAESLPLPAQSVH